MATRKRLVLFVEGEGDRRSAPLLIKRLLTESNAWDCLTLDDQPFQVGSIANLTGRHQSNWLRWLEAAQKRPHLGAVLLFLDGDARAIEGGPFCARQVACWLA